MYELKIISAEAVPGALNKAERYRLLNEPREAESICRDVLQADPDNQQGLVLLLLSLTDQFGRGCDVALKSVQDLLTRLHGEYERAYYAGVILERWGKAQLQSGIPCHTAYDWLREAMQYYAKAEAIHPPENLESILRWNTCARIINQGSAQETTTARRTPTAEPDYDDEVPVM
ncbi:MAG: hypothetical protein V3T70_09985 [Phycisphaerae bacterium]